MHPFAPATADHCCDSDSESGTERATDESRPMSVGSSDRVPCLRRAIREIRRKSISSRYARRIRAAYRREYEVRHAATISALVRGYCETGLPVPFLSVCGRGTQEIRFTKLLRYFLDPREPHGLGYRLLEAGFGKLVREVDDKPVEWSAATVAAEVDLGNIEGSAGEQQGNKLDLLVVAGDVAVLLEQKILSAEDVGRPVQDEVGSEGAAKTFMTQLARYADAFEKGRYRFHPWGNESRQGFPDARGVVGERAGGRLEIDVP